MSDRTRRVLYTKEDHVARITLNRPEVLNALDSRTHAELADVWDDFETDPDIWVGILSGAGDRAFSVGQDLKELAAQRSQTSTFGSRGKPGWPRLTERFDRTKPIVAKVQGYALGGGFELALACDLIVAADDATFALPEAQLGLIPGAGGVFRLARQLPFRTAMGHLLTSRPISGARAHAFGLVNEAVPAARLENCVAGWVEDILRCAPLSVRAIKQAAEWSATAPLAQAFAGHYPAEVLRMHSVDSIEGPRAFVEKRAPVWLGR